MLPFMPNDPRLAFVYIPFQKFENLYSNEAALKNGTIFKDLNIPFESYKDNPIMNPYKTLSCK